MPKKKLDDLFEHNIKWAAERLNEDADYFKRLSNLQAPEYLWIGCSDSRVPANVITGLQPGEVFVHRNVANLVHPTDVNLLSVLYYAVNALGVKHIIVCGHYGCGGVHAAVGDDSNGIVDHWLQPIRDVAKAHRKELSKLSDHTDRHNRLCELSVMSQVSAIARTPIVEAAWGKGNPLTIHGWIYGLQDGLLRDLECSRSGESS